MNCQTDLKLCQEKLGYHFDHPYTAWFQPQIVRTAKEKSQHG